MSIMALHELEQVRDYIIWDGPAIDLVGPCLSETLTETESDSLSQ